MISKTLGKLNFTPATPKDLDEIANAFTDTKLNPYPSQRFSHDVEKMMRSILLSGLLDPNRKLLIAHDSKRKPVAFIILGGNEKSVFLFLSGVWPAWRGKGIFRHIIESLIITLPKNGMITILSHPEHQIANRQLEKVGYKLQGSFEDVVYYVRRNL